MGSGVFYKRGNGHEVHRAARKELHLLLCGQGVAFVSSTCTVSVEAAGVWVQLYFCVFAFLTWTCDVCFHYISHRVCKATNRPSLTVYLQHVFKTLQI